MDGFLPSELQPRYPDGVCLQASATPSSWHGDFAGWSESGERTYELSMLLTDTIGDLRQHLTHIRGGNSDYEIISTFPQRVYTDSSRSLQECGLVPRASLLLRRRNSSQQEGRGLQTP
ncbi:UBX domain-containing protein 11 [Lonchura striata]|uniref:UBX domain-containing protein 11 n=1 Tax=Lonchura striata TaxID=40157 RepID=A0A218UKM6_9PASE|nr:UBX domain-containing protein 11 [Lonchura striata domestica]